MAMPHLTRRSVSFLIASLFILACLVAAVPAGADSRLADFKSRPGRFTVFESGQVRPLALSPSGKLLFAANTPDDRLEVFRVKNNGLELLTSIPVGLGGFMPGPAGDLQKRQVEDFILAFDSNLAPIVGQQTTLTKDNAGVAGERIDLLIDRARAGECDLVVKGGSEHGEKGYLYDVASDRFLGNRRSDAPISDANLRLRAFQDGGELTYTCTPPGSGARMGIDRDENGILDGDEGAG